MSLAERVYKALLGLYPKDFRERYALEMMQTFHDAHRQARLEGKTFAFWFRTLMDAISSATRERMERRAMIIVRVGALCFLAFGLLYAWKAQLYFFRDITQWPNIDGLPQFLLFFALTVLALCGLIAAEKYRPHALEMIGYAIMIGGAVLQFLYKLLPDSSVLRSLQWWPDHGLVPALVALTLGGLLRSRTQKKPRVQLESVLLGVLVAWLVFANLVIYRGNFVTLGSYVPLELRIWLGIGALVPSLCFLGLGVVLWRKSFNSSLPPRAKTA
jgi:hypothetical protein